MSLCCYFCVVIFLRWHESFHDPKVFIHLSNLDVYLNLNCICKLIVEIRD